MKELSFEQMEEIQGGLSCDCALAAVSLVATYGAITAAAAPVTAAALFLEASAWIATAGGWDYGCANFINITNIQYYETNNNQNSFFP